MLYTDRLILRRWRDHDLMPFATLNADSRVMEFFPKCLTRAESDDLVARIEERFEQRGYGFWAVQVVGGRSSSGSSASMCPASKPRSCRVWKWAGALLTDSGAVATQPRRRAQPYSSDFMRSRCQRSSRSRRLAICARSA